MGIQTLAAVAAGGAFGAVFRFLVMGQIGHWLGTGFPYATLGVNVLGSFILGALIETLALFWSPGATTQAFLTIGILGAFTTFSTFSLDVVTQIHRGDVMAAFIYVLLSVVLSVAALFAGLYMIKGIAV